MNSPFSTYYIGFCLNYLDNNLFSASTGFSIYTAAVVDNDVGFQFPVMPLAADPAVMPDIAGFSTSINSLATSFSL